MKSLKEKQSQLLEFYRVNNFEEAENLACFLVKDFPNDLLSWKVLDAILKQTGRIKESLESSQVCVKLQPAAPDTHNNLGLALNELGNLNEAEKSYKKAISIKPNFHQAFNNLGITLKNMSRLKEAKENFLMAIKLQPSFYEAFNNLGTVLSDEGDLIGAAKSYRRSIELNSSFSDAYFNLGVVSYRSGDDSALSFFETAYKLNSRPINKTMIALIKKKRERGLFTSSGTDAIKSSKNKGCKKYVTSRPIDEGLVENLYQFELLSLSKTRHISQTDARYGKGFCNPDFNLFENSDPILKKLQKELTDIMSKTVNREIYIGDSFVNIMNSEAGTKPHAHINDLDVKLGFQEQKWSLVYYLNVGDQNCSEPGYLTLFEPKEVILPKNEMIIIIPASRRHCSSYNGKKDRIMIGVNFYGL